MGTAEAKEEHSSLDDPAEAEEEHASHNHTESHDSLNSLVIGIQNRPPVLGADYCTYSFDYDCYPGNGKPECCLSEEVECPVKQPPCLSHSHDHSGSPTAGLEEEQYDAHLGLAVGSMSMSMSYSGSMSMSMSYSSH